MTAHFEVTPAPSVIGRLRRLDAEATPARWYVRTKPQPAGHEFVDVEASDRSVRLLVARLSVVAEAADADLIAAARNALPLTTRLHDAVQRCHRISDQLGAWRRQDLCVCQSCTEVRAALAAFREEPA